jgi:Fe-S-cluster containining protein
MSTDVINVSEPTISCTNCKACCCRLEVFLLTDTGVPSKFIQTDQWGGQVMARLEDGWCAALDRETYSCSIYENRPLVCREFATGSYECQVERSENAL